MNVSNLFIIRLNVHEHRVLAHSLVRVVYVQHLRRIPALDVGETRSFHTLTDYELSDFQTKRPSAAARVEINSNISESRTGDSSTI